MKIQLKTPIGGGKSLFYSTNWFKTACRFRCKSLVSHTQTLVPVFLRQKHLRPLNLHLSRPSHARNSESCICHNININICQCLKHCVSTPSGRRVRTWCVSYGFRRIIRCNSVKVPRPHFVP